MVVYRQNTQFFLLYSSFRVKLLLELFLCVYLQTVPTIQEEFECGAIKLFKKIVFFVEALIHLDDLPA